VRTSGDSSRAAVASVGDSTPIFNSQRAVADGRDKLHHRGGERIDWTFAVTAALNNVVRLRTLLAAV